MERAIKSKSKITIKIGTAEYAEYAEMLTADKR